MARGEYATAAYYVIAGEVIVDFGGAPGARRRDRPVHP